MQKEPAVHCIYHGGGCLDGFTSAWIVAKKFPDVVLHPANYGDPIPAIPDGVDVFVVDFSYPPEQLVELAKGKRGVVVIDHHLGAVRRLAEESTIELPDNVELHLDLDRSGAGLTWKYLFPDKAPPMLVTCVEDRDLWRFKEPLTKEYCRFLGTLDQELQIWTNAAENVIEGVSIGGILLCDDRKAINWHLDNAMRMVEILGYKVPMVNVPKYLVSETLNAIVEGHPFVVGYHDTETHRVLRFNSQTGTGMNCDELARQLGGGGHYHAAGAMISRDHPLAQI